MRPWRPAFAHLLFAFVALLVGCNGPTNPPTISAFTATPASITAGQSATLAWTVADATSVQIDSAVGDVTGKSSVSVTPATTITYTLTATNKVGSATMSATVTVIPPDPWAAVTSTIQAAQSQFPGGLTVELMTPDGVVYSQNFGAYTNQTRAAVASSSKWVSGTVLMTLVEQGTLNLGMKPSDYLKDRNGQTWAGNMKDITLGDLLDFQSGIVGDTSAADDSSITLDEAVLRIYDACHGAAVRPGIMYSYGSNHLRIAARMAEVVTGKPWRTLFNETLHDPLGWAASSTYGNGNNPNPAGSLACTGEEYVRFVMMQLRKGMYGITKLLDPTTIDLQRQDRWNASTVIQFSPYKDMGFLNHYGYCNWLEGKDSTQDPSPTNPVQRISSTGKFGWAPWVEVGNGQNWAGVIMCQQPDTGVMISKPSDDLKRALADLIPAALAQNPPVIRRVP